MGIIKDSAKYDVTKWNNPLRHIPDLNLLRLSKNSNNINSEELLEIWKNTEKEIYSYLQTHKFPENEIFRLEYKKNDENFTMNF